MNQYISQVKEFHENFNHPINDQKNEIPLNVRQLRVKLLFEELKELANASDVNDTFSELCKESITKSLDGNNVNKKEELDALCDIQYVLSGAILALGFQNEFDEAFSEVHSSNMSKMCSSVEEVITTMKDYKEKDGTESFYVEKGDKWIVLRQSDCKILKNSFYKPADLSKFIK